jgi:proline iminopeptidase
MQAESIITVNGVRLWTCVQGNGHPLVLCHGGAGAYDYLKPVADMVDDLCQVVRYDQRGSGRSEVKGPYDVATFVDDLECLRRHFGFERWIVGGRWHDEYRKNRLAALPEGEREEFRRLRARRDQVVGDERARIQKRFCELSRKTDAFDPARVGDTPAYDQHPTSDEVNRLIGADWEKHIQNASFCASVRKLPIPALLLHGAGDPRPARFVQSLAAQLPHGQFRCLDQCGHYPWIERPKEFRPILRRFLGGISS